jgi:hypothetical protein
VFKVAAAVLVSEAVWFSFIGQGDSEPHLTVLLDAGETPEVLRRLSMIAFIGPLLFALRTLRLVTLPGGALAQLGAGTAYVPLSRLEKLVWWKRAIVVVVSAAAFLLLSLSVSYAGTNPTFAVSTAATTLGLMPTLGAWWLSLKVGAALTAAPVSAAKDAARAHAKQLRATGGAIDAARWRAEVEEPALRLGRETL